MSQESKRRAAPGANRIKADKSTLKPDSTDWRPAKPLSTFAAPLPPPLRASQPQAQASSSQPPQSSQSPSTRSSQKSKGKQKAVEPSSANDSLWVDVHYPLTEDDLVVHKKKLETIRQWMCEALDGKLSKYRRILALTGPAGAGKTAAIHVLARELDFEAVEWSNSMDDADDDLDRETLSRKFQNFLSRAASYRPLLSTSAAGPSARKRRVIVLEDLPNILHPVVLQSFHAALLSFTEQPPAETCPLVLIVSDAGLRAEDHDDRHARDAAINIRTVLPQQLLNSPYVTQVAFNPVAPTRLRKALQVVLAKEEPQRKGIAAAELLDAIVAGSNGDVRAAIMALQFACVVDVKGAKAKGKKAARPKDILEAVTKRECSLALFHLLGKLLYNKRKGDPPGASLSAKDADREREADKRIPDPPKLPRHLRQEHHRAASRVDVNTLYSDSPVDSSLLALYLHQNYTQFCTDVDEAWNVCEYYSLFDVPSRTEDNWIRAPPHAFHLLTLGVLHSLPTPVPRTGQKMYKPEFFETLRKTREAEGGARDVLAWLGSGSLGHKETVTELGAVLRASGDAPSSHVLFSVIKSESERRGAGTRALDEDGDAADADLVDDGTEGREGSFVGTSNIPSLVELEKEHGWLENDMIEDD
ncbi:P-loop containing nucleoside triphosphate hydrolase protein [Auricularia subglabra TFB-10046 SS5]|nr:P-loop containing nucleoside triphosphate hydrolase protein [Auricularia subglabra TFB-10046 SS5]